MRGLTRVAAGRYETGRFVVERFPDGWRWYNPANPSQGGEWRRTMRDAYDDLLAFLADGGDTAAADVTFTVVGRQTADQPFKTWQCDQDADLVIHGAARPTHWGGGSMVFDLVHRGTQIGRFDTLSGAFYGARKVAATCTCWCGCGSTQHHQEPAE